MSVFRTPDKKFLERDDIPERGLEVVAMSNETIRCEKHVFRDQEFSEIELSKRLKEFSSYMFYNSQITNIEIPEMVNSLNEYCLARTRNLKQLVIPGSVEFIDECVLSESGIKSLTLQDGIIHVGKYCCENCYELQDITIPSSVKLIPEGMCKECESLEEVNIANGVKRIATKAFEGCSSIKHLFLPESVEDIQDFAFARCNKLESIHIDREDISIPLSAIENCPNLQEITFGDKTITADELSRWVSDEISFLDFKIEKETAMSNEDNDLNINEQVLSLPDDVLL